MILMKKRLTFFIAIFASILVFVSLVKTIYRTYQSGKRLSTLGVEVESLEGEKETLEKILTERKSEEFLEKEAREKLNLVKPGETLVVLETTEDTEESAEDTEKGIFSLSNPQRWWYLFFGK